MRYITVTYQELFPLRAVDVCPEQLDLPGCGGPTMSPYTRNLAGACRCAEVGIRTQGEMRDGRL